MFAAQAAATLGQGSGAEAQLDTRAAAADRALARLDAESVLATDAYRDRVLDVADAEESGAGEDMPPGQDRGLASLLLSYTSKASRRRSQRVDGRLSSAATKEGEAAEGEAGTAALNGVDTAGARELARRMEQELASAGGAGPAVGAYSAAQPGSGAGRGAGGAAPANAGASRDSPTGAGAARSGTVVNLRVGGSNCGVHTRAQAQIPDAVFRDGLSVTDNACVAGCISALRGLSAESSPLCVARKAEGLLAELRDSIHGWCSLRRRPTLEAWREVARALQRPIEPLMELASKAGVLEGSASVKAE